MELPQLSPYFETAAMPNIPGKGNLLTLPFDFISSIQDLKGAFARQDRQSLVEASIRSVGLPFNAVNSVEQNLELGHQMHVIKGYSTSLLAKISGIFGIILCLVEMCIEGNYIRRQKKFLKKLDSKESLQDKMRWISKKYFEVDEKKRVTQFTKLSRLLQPFAAQELHRDLPLLFHHFYDKNSVWGDFDGDNWATKMITQIKTQSEKKVLFHSIGLVTLFITLIGLVLTLIPPIPLFVGGIFISGGVVLGITRFVLNKGYYDNPGWTFTANKLLPPWIAKRVGIGKS